MRFEFPYARIYASRSRANLRRTLAAICLLLLSPAALATRFTQTLTWPTAGPAYAADPWTEAQPIAMFDRVLGTLDSVSIQFDAESWGLLQVETPWDATFRLGSQVRLLDAEGSVLFDLMPKYEGTGGNFTLSIGHGPEFGQGGVLMGVAGGTLTYADPNELSAWIGTGTLSFTSDSSDKSWVSAGSILVSNGYAGSRMIVTYDYTPSPEPAPALLSGAALLMFAALRKRGQTSRSPVDCATLGGVGNWLKA